MPFATGSRPSKQRSGKLKMKDNKNQETSDLFGEDERPGRISGFFRVDLPGRQVRLQPGERGAEGASVQNCTVAYFPQC